MSRGARNGVRLPRPTTVSRRVIIPYLFTRIPSLECRSGSGPRQEGVHSEDSGVRPPEDSGGAPRPKGARGLLRICDM
ncbi:hypothetical protein GCM10010339_58050 [Streptomyces alanosinicus]|uniref:Uncharacterized protein n=1 Tax=Streptomyces alanosinicus TaxID=68171 RepID=A0A919D5D0_9ACTN|nr:hypothetical protein GCM10010339_58050 [Streptomyces alanosinicus]